MAFALLAHHTLCGCRATCRPRPGAVHPVVLGHITPGASRVSDADARPSGMTPARGCRACAARDGAALGGLAVPLATLSLSCAPCRKRGRCPRRRPRGRRPERRRPLRWRVPVPATRPDREVSPRRRAVRSSGARMGLDSDPGVARQAAASLGVGRSRDRATGRTPGRSLTLAGDGAELRVAGEVRHRRDARP
jgi:hypothetical protein